MVLFFTYIPIVVNHTINATPPERLQQKTSNTAFVVLSFNFQVWRYLPTVAMSLLSTLSTVCQSPSACMVARSLVHAYVLETVVDKSEV